VPSIFSAEHLDENGYPAWISELSDEESGTINLYVVRGLGPAQALERMGYPPDSARPVALPAERPADRWSSRLMEALSVQSGDEVALLSTQVGEWTLVVSNGLEMDEGAVDLSLGGLEAAECSDNIEADTHFIYAVDGAEIFTVSEPVSVYPLDELPDRLQPAARTTGIYDVDIPEDSWNVAENFLLVCALAGLERLPLLGWAPTGN
jgi:hypothetical protein